MSERNHPEFVRNHHDLEVYQDAFRHAMTVFELTKSFPVEERYARSDQIRRSSRAVCANVAEAWRKRRCERSFVLRLLGTLVNMIRRPEPWLLRLPPQNPKTLIP